MEVIMKWHVNMLYKSYKWIKKQVQLIAFKINLNYNTF